MKRMMMILTVLVTMAACGRNNVGNVTWEEYRKQVSDCFVAATADPAETRNDAELVNFCEQSVKARLEAEAAR